MVAFVAAFLFGVHPVHLESVAWVSGVTDPLMCVFLIGAFLMYLKVGLADEAELESYVRIGRLIDLLSAKARLSLKKRGQNA